MYTNFRLHDGVRICHLDFTHVQDEEEALKRVNEAKEIIAKEPPKSVYTITDVTGSRATPKIRAALHQLTQHNKPFVISGAVVGMTPIQRGMLRGIILLTGRKLVAVESMEEAVAALKKDATQTGVSA
jgi:hypothetical protein